MAEPRRTISNAFTIDLEDWAQAALGGDRPITDRVLRNADRVLELLAGHGVRATFFALGKVCEKFPSLLPTVASAGHEIATHGYGHELVFSITPERFRADLQRSIDIVEAQVGRRPIGYRAPGFSISEGSRWAGPIMVELGIKYSSSIFPIAGRRYGIPTAPRFPHRWPACELMEFPLSTVRRFGRNLPICGGGYFRLLPRWILARAIREINRHDEPAVVYIHPYEMDVHELDELRRQGWQIGGRKHLTQSLFRRRIRRRVTGLLEEFRFTTMADVLGFA